MNTPILKTIQSEFAPQFIREIPNFFKENLVFAFICGGFSKGYADENHDIDMFICLSQTDLLQIDKFKQWYFKIHEHYNLPSDENDPGEIVTYSKLRGALDRLTDFTITTFNIEQYEVYEAIVWGDMLSGKIIGVTGNIHLLKELLAECKGYPDKWKEQILPMLSDEEKGYWKDMTPQLLMEKYMKYPKCK